MDTPFGPTFDAEDPRHAAAVDEVSLWSSRFGAMLLDHLELGEARAVLDLGCGTGFPVIELAQRQGRSAAFVAVDIWRAGLERAAAKASTHALHNVEFIVADGAALPFGRQAFDLIVSNVGVNNFEHPQAALAECGRVARPGARLALTTNLEGHMREFYLLFRAVLEERHLDDAIAGLVREEAHRTTRARLCALVESAGFEVARVIEDGFDLRYRDGSALFRHSLTRFGFLEGWMSVVEPAEQATAFASLERRLNERARAAGELRMHVPMLYLEATRRPTD